MDKLVSMKNQQTLTSAEKEISIIISEVKQPVAQVIFSHGAGADMHHSEFCSVKGATIFQCIEGHVTLKTPNKQTPIQEGQLVFLEAGTEHALIGVEKSVVLLTIVL